MSKSLEALEKLEIFVNYKMGIKHFHESGWHIAGSNEYATIEKELKAMEIIIGKNVVPSYIKRSPNVDFYNSIITGHSMLHSREDILLKDEFDLLKEVLKNE